MIVDIGSWVLNEACAQAAQWMTQWPDRRICVTVNISSRQVLRGDIVEIVRDALSTSGLDPTLLALELTETTLIDDAISVQAILRDLRDQGVTIALDDFGTGYSSLTYLRTFPINIIKIDGSFIRTIETEREAAAIVAAVISLAKSLDITVIAEGIETLRQLAAVVDLDCDLLQGYLLSHPKEAEALPALINSSFARFGRDHASNNREELPSSRPPDPEGGAHPPSESGRRSADRGCLDGDPTLWS